MEKREEKPEKEEGKEGETDERKNNNIQEGHGKGREQRRESKRLMAKQNQKVQKIWRKENRVTGGFEGEKDGRITKILKKYTGKRNGEKRKE